MSNRWLIPGLSFTFLQLAVVPNGIAQGVIFPSVGAVNRAMSGASTAAPLDPAGATYWNPATMSAFTQTEIYVGGDFVYGDTFMASSAEFLGAAGENRSDSGLSAAPVIGVISRPGNSSYTFGLGIYSLLGRTVDFPGDSSNPVLAPFDPPRSFGFGPVSASLTGLQVSMLMSKQLSRYIAVGGGLIVDSVSLSLDPALFADRNPNGTYPPATNSRPRWGSGFQVGIYYSDQEKWNFGASFKTEQWFETFKYNSKTTNGTAKDLEADFALPSILSFGVGYQFNERTLIAVDARRFDYGNADLFGDSPENDGLGWRSIWAFAVGAHYRVNDFVSAQAGYLYNQNPIPQGSTFFNIQLPAINTNSVSGGVTVALTESVDLVGSAVYAFTQTNRSSILEVPGTEIQLKQDLGTFSLGLRFRL
jgi:long-chain fatty acid transport protein